LRSRFAEATLAEYVEYTRREQAEKLAVAIRETKRRFPRCGGFLIWMGHDCFPCPSNTSLIEFDHRPKPAVAAVAAEFKTPVSFP
jgi:beta-mannosidase